jgi:spermidine synthase
LSALLLIPVLGTRRTFLTFALACAVVAVLGIPRRSAVLVPAMLVLLLVLPVGTIKAADGKKVLEEVETQYQYARVVEDPNGDRHLELNEGQAVHSTYKPGSYLTGDYWDEFLLLPLATLTKRPNRLAMLGNAAGTTARAYGHYFPDTHVDGVEIDSELTRLGREWFDLRNARLDLFHEDARPFLRRTDRHYDVIGVDVYRQPYIPFYLTTREFFELARDRLTEGGVVVVNVGHPEGQDELEKVLSATMAEVFPTVVRDAVEDTNTVVMGTAGAVSPGRLESSLADLHADLQRPGRRTAARIRPRLPGGSVYTDDKAPVEWLVDRSIVDYAAGE